MTLTAQSCLRRFAAGTVIAAAAIALPSAASAGRLMTENFEYNLGNLYGQGGWLQYATDGNPIQVVADQLVYPGYQSEKKGFSAKIKPVDNTDQDLKKPYTTKENQLLSGSVYMAALVNVTAVDAETYVLCFTQSSNGELIDKKNSSEWGRVFVSPGDNGGYKLGFSKYSSTLVGRTDDIPFGTTSLVVVKYEVVEGSTNDVASMWVNPVKSDTEPDADFSSSDGADPYYNPNAANINGLVGVTLRQGTTASKNCPEMTFGALRVATTWADLFEDGEGGETPSDATVTATPLTFRESCYQHQKFESVITVRGTNLTEDITVGGLTSGEVTASASSISAEEACAGEGVQLTLTLNPVSGNSVNDVLTLTSGDANVSMPIQVYVVPVTDEVNLRALSMKPTDWETTYRYTGKMARVTYVDEPNTSVYIEDMTGAVRFDYSYMFESCPVKVGDKVTNIYCMALDPELGVTPFMYIMGEVTAEGSFKEPTEVSLGELAASPEDYINRLVKVSDVTFNNVAEGAVFGTASIDISSPYMSGTASGKTRSFAGTDLIGKAIPATATSITGISTSAAAAVVTMRSAEDLVAPEEETTLDVTSELLVDANEYYPINVETTFAKFTVKTVNLPSAGMVWPGGTNRDMFSIDTEEIPAGTGETVITVTYKPTAKGTHSCNINFDVTPTELSQSIAIRCKAYDPDNLPTLSVDQSGLTAFEANVGETAGQEINYTVSGGLDYGTVRVLGKSNGAFRISTTTMMKDGTYPVTITFAPQAEGEFSEDIEFSTDKAETVIVTVTGSTSGGLKPEEKQGDELTFDSSNPFASYSTGFDSTADNNSVLSLQGWKNVALEGTRAWWTYQVEGNSAAKITAYDSKATEDTPVKMMLVSPALDYKNCTNRLLSFRIMGQYLTDSTVPELLEVVYIDATEPDDVYYQVIDGLNIPATSDYNDEWIDYVIDLEGLDLADTFFIGFRFTAERGRNSVTTYYVDDFTYGSDDISFIRVDTPRLAMESITGASAVSGEITVTGLNLTGEISLSLEGSNPGKFGLSTTTLPAQGGTFTVTFSPEEDGIHQAYVRLQSEGAPDSYIEILAEGKPETGVGMAGVENEVSVAAYDLNGALVVAGTDASSALEQLRGLAKGVYILRAVQADGTVRTVKYLRP